jgi:hypothetical protein
MGEASVTGLIQRNAARNESHSEEKKPLAGRRKRQPPECLQDIIGEQLRLYYAELTKEPLPARLTTLVQQLTARERRQ